MKPVVGFQSGLKADKGMSKISSDQPYPMHIDSHLPVGLHQSTVFTDDGISAGSIEARMPARYSITNQRPLCWSMHLEPSCSGVVLLAPKMVPICTTGTLHMLVCSGRSAAFRPLFELLFRLLVVFEMLESKRSVRQGGPD